MVSGKPLSEREKKFLRDNKNEEFPSILARHLVMFYAEDNGGSRCTETVKIYLKSLDRAQKAKARVK